MKHTSIVSSAPDLATKLCILVVEDEFLIRFVIADQLRDEGFNVLEAASGDEAITILNSSAPIDLVFTDVKMPGNTDGMAVLDYVKANRPNIPVLVTSGHQDPLTALAFGANGFLGKPCDLAIIVATVRDTLKCTK